MTVKELREFLATLPEDAEVLTRSNQPWDDGKLVIAEEVRHVRVRIKPGRDGFTRVLEHAKIELRDALVIA